MFEDKKLLVTGGTGSIGSSICSYFNDNNCKEIYSTTTNINKIKSDQNYIKFKELDLNNIENLNLDELFDFDIDFLVLNAGLNKDNIFLRMSLDDWNSVINVNLNSSFHLLKHFTKKMVKNRFGRVDLFCLLWPHTESRSSELHCLKSSYFRNGKINGFRIITRNIKCQCCTRFYKVKYDRQIK